MKHIMLFILSMLFFIPIQAKSYGIKKGILAPDILSQDINGKEFYLKKEIKKGPIVIVFYRGGWCPYCNTQLRSLKQKLAPRLGNAQLVAISSDKMDEALKTRKKNKLGFRVISNPDAMILEDYNVATKKGNQTISVPSVFVIDKKGVIQYSYTNEDYKVRAQISDILKALKAVKN